jgi:hypothetical protein
MARALCGMGSSLTVRGNINGRFISARRRATVTETDNRRSLFVVLIVSVATLGPYVAGSIRTEQLAVYGLLLIVGITLAPTMRTSSMRGAAAWRLLLTWTLFLAVAAASSIGALWTTPRWPQGDLLAGLDNLVGPLAVMLLVWLTVDPRKAEDRLRTAAKAVAVALAGNGVLALVMTQVDLTWLLRPFWAAGAGETTAQLAASMGRVSGVFNQPAEAGVAYGLAGVCAWYVWHDRPTRLYLVLIPIVLGGLVSVSKVFVLGGLPLILWLVWRSRAAGSRLGLVFVTAAVALGLVQSGYAAQWSGLDYLTRLVSPGDEQAINFFTAGRFGEGSTLTRVIAEVARINPLWGVGAEGLQVPYDNGWVEAFVVAGLGGFALYTLTLLWLWRAGRADPDPARRTLLCVIAVLAAGSSLGVPALTANRASTLLWLIVALAVAASTHDRERAGGSPEGAVGLLPEAEVVDVHLADVADEGHVDTQHRGVGRGGDRGGLDTSPGAVRGEVRG